MIPNLLSERLHTLVPMRPNQEFPDEVLAADSHAFAHVVIVFQTAQSWFSSTSAFSSGGGVIAVMAAPCLYR